MRLWLMVGLGGALGSMLRLAVGRGFQWLGWQGAFPWSTYAVNSLGSLGLGLLAGWLSSEQQGSALQVSRLEYLQAFVGMGLMGGFTTYSTFNLDLLKLLEEGHRLRALAYASLTLASALVGGILGLWLGRRGC